VPYGQGRAIALNRHIGAALHQSRGDGDRQGGCRVTAIAAKDRRRANRDAQTDNANDNQTCDDAQGRNA
jgi:hypothetical protein